NLARGPGGGPCGLQNAIGDPADGASAVRRDQSDARQVRAPQAGALRKYVAPAAGAGDGVHPDACGSGVGADAEPGSVVIYKIGVSGVRGRMGLEVAALLGEGYELGADYFELSDAVAKSDKITSIEGVSIRTWDTPAREPVHAWIDFSRPEATVRMLDQISA